MKAAFLILSVLAGCSGGNSGGSSPSVSWPVPVGGQWASAFGQNPTANIGTSFSIPGGQGIHYVYTPAASIKTASNMSLTYTVSGDATFGINDPSDQPPPQVTLFIWEAGDNLSCQGSYVNARVFSNQRSPLQSGTYTLSAPLNQSAWHNCYGQAAGLSQAMGNAAYAGFTFGGADFDGHGVYVASSSATFTINNFTVQ